MAVKIFFCYAHEDEVFLNKLKKHLRPLQRQGLIDVWHDRDINAGMEWEQEVNKQLNEAQIILLLVSPDFIDSNYCYGTEMQRAMERHERGEARVIPVILRPVYWQGAPFGKLQTLPTDAKPVVSWANKDNAFLDITKGIRKAIEQLPSMSSAEKMPNLVTQKPNQQFKQLDLQMLLIEKANTENSELENRFQAGDKIFFDRLFNKYVQEILQALLSYQLPWGEWGDIGSEERLKRGDRVTHIGIQDVVLKPNVARSMFSIIQIQKLDLKKFNYRYENCLSWMKDQKINGWFYEWRLGQSNSSETNMPDLYKSPDIRHTAQSGTTAILLNQVDLSVIRTLENILNSQLHFGAWSNDPNSKQEALFSTAYCIEFIYNLLEFSKKKLSLNSSGLI